MSRRTLSSTAIPLGAVVAGAGLIFLLATGVSMGSALALTGVVAAQGLAGGYLWTLFRRQADAAEVVGAGLAVGTVAAVVSGLAVLVATGWTGGWALPLVIALAHRLATLRRRAQRSPVALDVGYVWGVALAVALGALSLIPNIRSYPLTWTGVWGGYHGDMLFFESIATSMAQLGPLDSIFSPGALIRYHWLTYAWAGQVTEAAGAEPFVTLTRALPFVAVVASSLIAVSWVRRLTAVAWAPALAVVLLITGGYVGATYGAIFNFDSPSQSLTTLWLLGFAVVLLEVVRTPRSVGARLGGLGLLGLLTFGLAGGKISAGAVALGAVLWLTAVGLLRRSEWRWRAATSVGVVVLAFLTGYVLVVMGSADPGGLKLFNLLDRASSIQGMNPVPGSLGIALGTLLLVMAIAARWAGVLWLIVRRDTRWSPDTILGVGFALAAVGTVVVLSGGMNDTWFALAASAPLAILSAAGAAEAWLSLGPQRRRALGWLVVCAVILTAVVSLLWLTGPSGGTVWVSSWRWMAPLAGVAGAVVIGAVIGFRLGSRKGWSALAGAVVLLTLVAAPGRALGAGSGQMGVQPGLGEEAFTPIQQFVPGIDSAYVREWSDSQVAAADFLRAVAAEGDLVATNVTYSPLVPALTGRQTLASGLAYQAPYGTRGDLAILVEREKQSWAFIDDPSATTARELCDSHVAWAWVDPSRTDVRAWEPYASVEFEAPDVIVLRMLPAACS